MDLTRQGKRDLDLWLRIGDSRPFWGANTI